MDNVTVSDVHSPEQVRPVEPTSKDDVRRGEKR